MPASDACSRPIRSRESRSEIRTLLGKVTPPSVEVANQTEKSRLSGSSLNARGNRTAPSVINVSRGELLDEAAVGAALDSGQLGGLGMDVGRAPDQRPSPELAARPGVVATPHLGGLTPENAFAQALSSVEQVEAMLDGNIPPRAVNADGASRLKDYLSI